MAEFRVNITLMKNVAFGVHIAASILFLFGFSAPLWYWSDDYDEYTQQEKTEFRGLWLTCNEIECTSNLGMGTQFRFIQALMCLAFICNVISSVFYGLWFCTHDLYGITRGAKIGFSFAILAGWFCAAGMNEYKTNQGAYGSLSIGYFCCEKSSWLHLVNPLLCLLALIFLDINKDSPDHRVIIERPAREPRPEVGQLHVHGSPGHMGQPPPYIQMGRY